MATDMETTETRASTLSDWAAPYVTDMLGRAQAYADLPFQPYEGALTAGPSALQTKAFEGIGGLTVPTSISQAGATLGNIAQQAAGMSYAPSQFASTYQAPSAYTPTQFENTFQAPAAYQTKEFQNMFKAPADYEAAKFANEFVAPQAYQTSTFTPEAYSQEAVQPYMNPYLEAVLTPQRREAQRQADIAREQMQARMAQAGAYGGSRQAIMEAEAQKNLQELLSDITGKGYASAFDVAQQQFGAEQARRMAAEQLREQSRQFGAGQAMTAAELQARYGLSARQAEEASRQFAAQQRMTAADLQAKYGLSAEQATEMSRQFGAQQAMTAADLQARYGLSALQATEASRQFGAQQAADAARQAAQFGLEAQRMGEQSRQFGAGFGLDALARQTAAAQAQAATGGMEAQYGLANLQEMARQGEAQRAIEQAGLTADYNQYLRELAYPEQMLRFQKDMITGLPISTVGISAPGESTLQSVAGGAATALELLKLLNQAQQGGTGG